MSLFSQFLAENKAKFLADAEKNDIQKWTIVMGNEAGDLDTVASSAAYSYLATKLQNVPTVALILTPRTDFYLRPENLYAFKLAGLDGQQQDLLCVDDVPASAINNTNFVLVDHNSLLPAFESKGKVVGIIDHHADEGHHLDAKIREVVNPTGSCASLVARHFKDSWNDSVPPQVATFLLCAIYIDTGGLKPDDKAVQIDYDAAEFLTPRSTFSQSSGSLQTDTPSITSLANELHERKADVANLSTRDLLRRDYKQFNFSGIQVGLATVPYGLKAWLKKDADFWVGLGGYMTERGISVLGVLTTYKSEERGKKKREILMLVDPKIVDSDVESRLFQGMEADDFLSLEAKSSIDVPDDRHARVWDQKNKKATRKQVAPLVKQLISGSPA